MWTEGRLSCRRSIIKNYLRNYRSLCADARYHQSCFTSFVSSRNIAAAAKSTAKQQKPDHVNLAFSCVISLLKSDPGKLWNSVQLCDVYSESLKLMRDLIMVRRDSTMLMLITLGRNVLDQV